MFSSEHWENIFTDWWKMLILVIVVFGVIATAIAIITVVCKRKGIAYTRSTKDLTYGAICLAASYALSFISLFSLPNGGTITPASALPLMIYCYYFGFRKSSVVCSAYMILQLIQKPYIVSPYSALLDYFVPFFALSFMGIFSYNAKRYTNAMLNKKSAIGAHYTFFIGVAIYFIVRYFSHTLAGVLFWANGIDFLIWGGDLAGITAWTYSLTYNALFLLPDTLIAAVAGAFVLNSKTFNRFMAAPVNTLQNADTAAKNN